MKVRQTYLCGENEKICVRYIYNKIGLIIGMTEIDADSNLEKDELNLPKIEVTDEMFNLIINNPKLS